MECKQLRKLIRKGDQQNYCYEKEVNPLNVFHHQLVAAVLALRGASEGGFATAELKHQGS